MRKAAALDVTVYEDPVFYDRLERARVQATDRLAMIQQMGRLIQQTVTASRIFGRTPLLLAISSSLARCRYHSRVSRREPLRVSYLRQEFPADPARRQMDYLRQVGGSKEAAKELKLFNLSEYLTSRFTIALAKRFTRRMSRSIAGGCSGARLLAIVGQLGYYGAYAYSIYRTIQGRYSIGDLTLITTAIMQAMGNIQQAFLDGIGSRRPGACFLPICWRFLR